MTPHSPLPHRWQQPSDSGERLFASYTGTTLVHLPGSHLIVQDLWASGPIWTASVSRRPGASDLRYGPVLGTIVKHNTVVSTGDENEAIVYSKRCNSTVLDHGGQHFVQ